MLRDEPLLLRIPARNFDRDGLAARECLRQGRDADGRKENAATCGVKEHPQRGGEMNHALDRNEILGSALEHRAKSVLSLGGVDDLFHRFIARARPRATFRVDGGGAPVL